MVKEPEKGSFYWKIKYINSQSIKYTISTPFATKTFLFWFLNKIHKNIKFSNKLSCF